MKLWHVEFIIADKHLHSTMQYLEGKAYNPKFKTVSNGAGEEKPKKKREGRKGNKDLPTQTEWLLQHLKGEMLSGEIRPDWIKAGYPKAQLYGALHRLTVMKKAKKMASGKFKLTGAE